MRSEPVAGASLTSQGGSAETPGMKRTRAVATAGLVWLAGSGILAAEDVTLAVTHQARAIQPGEVVVIEVQSGTYLGEDDIERLEDDFGRA